MKNIFRLLFISLIVLFISSCNQTFEIEFETFGGAEIPYQEIPKGEKLNIPAIPQKAGYQFVGWYKDVALTIPYNFDEEVSKSFTLYAKFQEIVPISIDSIKNSTSYSYDLEISYDNTKIVESYEYDQITLKQTINNHTKYLTKESLQMYLSKTNNTWLAFLTDSDEFKENASNFSYLLLDKISAERWMYNEGEYQPHPDYLNLEANEIFNYSNIVFNYLKISVDSQKIKYIETNFDLAGTTYTYKYVMKDFNIPKIQIPNYKIDLDKYLVSIADMKTLNKGKIVAVSGLVIHNFTNSCYLKDYTSSAFVIDGVVSSFNNTDFYNILGIIDKIGDTTILTDIIYTEKANQTGYLKPSIIDNLSFLTQDNQGMSVSINNLIVKSVTGEYLVVVDRYGNSGTIYKPRDTINQSFENIKTNDLINLENGLIYFDGTSYKIFVSNNTKLFNGNVYVESITANKTSFVVTNIDTIDNILTNLEIKALYNNQTTKVIPSSDFTYTHDIDFSRNGVYQLNIKYLDFNLKITINVVEYSEHGIYDEHAERIDDILEKTNFGKGLPTTGNSKILVIPVAFNDYPAPPKMKETLEVAFFGSSEDTGWESLTSYYYKSSFGKLNITGTVLEPYMFNKNSTYFDNLENADYYMLQEVMHYYDKQVDFSEYDSNSDGYIDSVYLVYTAPIDWYGDSAWWAYTYEYLWHDDTFDNVILDFYMFAGYDFLFENLSNGEKVALNLETFIHETGHLLGLDDYYDYQPNHGPNGGIGQSDMMDSNVGDHNSFSKTILGWMTPLILEQKSMTLKLSTIESGNALIIPKSWNGTYFDEYLILDYYVPTDLYEEYIGNYGVFSESGLRIYHVNASLKATLDEGIWGIYESNNSETDNKLIAVVENDSSSSILNDDPTTNEDLFQIGDVLEDYTWYDGTIIGCIIEVIEMTETEITIRITY